MSVVIPTYNPGALIDGALKSVLAQDAGLRVEVIVVDDGSSDGTPARLRSVFPTVHVLEQTNAGTAAARNAGVKAATGRFLALLDQDDAWDRDKLRRQLPLFSATDVGLVHSGARFVNAQGVVTSTERGVDGLDVHSLLTWCWLLQSTAIVRRDVLDEVGPFDVALSAADDWDMWIRLAAATRFAVVPEPLTSVLVHPGNQSNDAERMYESARALLDKHRRIHMNCAACEVALRSADATNRREFYRRTREQAKTARREGDFVGATRLTVRALLRHRRAVVETAAHHVRRS